VSTVGAQRPFRLLLGVPVPWVFVLTYLIGVALERVAPPAWEGRHAAGLGAAGVVLLALGVFVAGWGWLTFRKAHTTTVPGQTSTQLVTWGPYRFTRNPMYVGLVLAYVGEAGILRQVWPPVVLPLVVAYLHRIVIPVEESKLREAFGERYERYRERVRRWI
jgi:protein-S-isoprenylcysteine O-methyltransferase Ste14